MTSTDRSNDAGDLPIGLRSGMTVRVTNPNSPHYGATGHLLGRNEQREPYWLVRITTTAAPIHLLEEEMIVVR